MMKEARSTVTDWIGEEATQRLEESGVGFIDKRKLTQILTDLVTERYKLEQQVKELEGVIEVLIRY